MTFILKVNDLISSYILLYLLKKGKNVRVLRTKKCIDILKHIFNYYNTQKTTNFLLKNIEWVNDDIFNTSIFEGIDEVYYTNNLISLWQGFFKKNITDITDVINICIATGVKKICYINSIFISNDQVNNHITELFLTNKLYNNDYYTKFLSEIEVWRGNKEGLNVIIVNPSIVLASGFWKKKNLFEFIINKSPIGTIGCIDVRDVAKCCIRLMDENHINERYLLNSENISYEEIRNINNIYSFNKKRKIFLKKNFNKKILNFFKKNYIHFSNEKIIKILKYKFIPVKESIQEHIKRYKKEC
ncbi:MAG: hypothetical protein NHF86_00110 [Candidatus Bostrichicola ureolyticus]|nr:MAG: hypothetical protein NHF86_00110 [Candidatus Bostrichicola ureolyticus]